MVPHPTAGQLMKHNRHGSKGNNGGEAGPAGPARQCSHDLMFCPTLDDEYPRAWSGQEEVRRRGTERVGGNRVAMKDFRRVATAIRRIRAGGKANPF